MAQVSWNLRQLSTPPETFSASDFHEQGLRALFYRGEPWQGKPTRIFAWYGVPAHPSTERLPAMVLVHGGMGTAFADWVRLWNARGYAAIAIDTCGSVPVREKGGTWQRHEFAGPPCWSLDQGLWPVEDQWTYHAVADVILANSLLRSFPEIDPEAIGITGISWGGYLTAIVASLDTRFRFAVPVYGCGYLGEDSYWLSDFAKLGPIGARHWLELWDPSVYLPKAKMPFLWVDGTNDEFYPLESVRKSYLLPLGPRTLSTHVRMPHDYKAGEPPEEIHAFADYFLKSGKPLAKILELKRNGNSVWITYSAQVPIVKAELNYTSDSGAWNKRRWLTIPATLDGVGCTARAKLPDRVTAFYFDVIDQRNLLVSSDLQDRD
jgi:dienelactone hydrolase